MGLIVLSVEGVLAEVPPGANLLTIDSLPQGRVLYSLLQPTAQILLLSTDIHKESVKSWLAANRFLRYADLQCRPFDYPGTGEDWKLHQLGDMVAAGHHISFVIDTNPRVLETALELGLDTMLAGYTGSLSGRRDSDMSYQPWYDLTESIAQQADRRAMRILEEAEDG